MIGWKPSRFIFIHIPKCAGTSIEKALLPIASQKADFVSLTENERSRFWLPGKAGLQHSKLRRYGRHFPIKTFFKFAVVRNPWDRAISQINYLATKAQAPIFLNRGFKEQVREYCNTGKNIWGHDLGACQIDYLTGKSGHIGTDYIARFECLDNDFKEICKFIGIDAAPPLPHIFNAKRSSHYSAFYDEESAEWIKKRFAKDIDAFGYKFEKVT